MSHYICIGECKGVSEFEKICDRENCSQKGMPFEECTCEDGTHGRAPVEGGEDIATTEPLMMTE